MDIIILMVVVGVWGVLIFPLLVCIRLAKIGDFRLKLGRQVYKNNMDKIKEAPAKIPIPDALKINGLLDEMQTKNAKAWDTLESLPFGDEMLYKPWVPLNWFLNEEIKKDLFWEWDDN